jgi:protein-S-isoprenylcysteine O-methyltransferase Ste14
VRILRHLVAIVALPLTVAGGVPWWLARRSGSGLAAPEATSGWLVVMAGGLVLVAGLVLFAASLRRFGGEGDGTLAPWDPPKRLVVTGPYGYVRNPMISGVLMVLVGEGLFLRSAPHLTWAAVFALANACYIPIFEASSLWRRCGRDYDEYAGNVPRLIPRLRPWRR